MATQGDPARRGVQIPQRRRGPSWQRLDGGPELGQFQAGEQQTQQLRGGPYFVYLNDFYRFLYLIITVTEELELVPIAKSITTLRKSFSERFALRGVDLKICSLLSTELQVEVCREAHILCL